MAELKNITIVSYFDDNYGDMLIKDSFECLLKTVLKNIGVEACETHRMNLKQIDEKLLEKSDLICFAGGGLFGLSYLNFYEYLKSIMDIAEANNIPVIFSSMGINNMDYKDGDDSKLREVLKYKCIKAISVREQEDWFKKYLGRDEVSVEKVCDPALWSQFLLPEKKLPANHKMTLGINIVRNNLFVDNGYTWEAKKQFEYVDMLIKIAEDHGYDYILYTNGSLGDNRALKDYVQSNDIKEENYKYTETTQDLMEIIQSCDFVCAIRLHSAIIATAFEKPSITVVWNEKINHFYDNIGYPDAAISEDDAEFSRVENAITSRIGKKQELNKEYIESLYKYLFNNIKDITNTNPDIEQYSIAEVAKHMRAFYQENETAYLIEDYEFKDNKLLSNYFKLDNKMKETKAELSALKKEAEKLRKDNAKMKASLDRINSKLPVKIYKRVKKTFK